MVSKSTFLDELASMTREDIDKIFEEKRFNIRTKKIFPMVILGKEDSKGGESKEQCTINN